MSTNPTQTPAQRVAEMNEAFGNPAGNFPPDTATLEVVRAQCRNIFDEYTELLEALGYSRATVDYLKLVHENVCQREYLATADATTNVENIRDALCDIQVFAQGAQHLLGVNSDEDMHSVIDGVMTRFIKDEDDKLATIELHAKRGITHVYFEGEFPKMVMKSASNQPDAPKGKFLKSASYAATEFQPSPTKSQRTSPVENQVQDKIPARRRRLEYVETGELSSENPGLTD